MNGDGVNTINMPSAPKKKSFIAYMAVKKKIIFVFSSVCLLIAVSFFVGIDQYNRHKYAFIIDGKGYTKQEIRKLIATPQKIDKKTDYVKLAFKYYEYLEAQQKTQPYISNDIYNYDKLINASKYGLNSDTKDAWVALESKFDVLDGYIKTNLMRSENKTGYSCVFFLSASTMSDLKIENIITYLQGAVKFNETNSYDITNLIDQKDPSLDTLNGYCFNFGFGDASWTTDVKIKSIVNSLENFNRTGMSGIVNDNANNLKYFYNLSSNPIIRVVDSSKFLNTLDTLTSKYYGI